MLQELQSKELSTPSKYPTLEPVSADEIKFWTGPMSTKLKNFIESNQMNEIFSTFGEYDSMSSLHISNINIRDCWWRASLFLWQCIVAEIFSIYCMWQTLAWRTLPSHQCQAEVLLSTGLVLLPCQCCSNEHSSYQLVPHYWLPLRVLIRIAKFYPVLQILGLDPVPPARVRVREITTDTVRGWGFRTISIIFTLQMFKCSKQSSIMVHIFYPSFL